MKTLILDGSHANDQQAINIVHALRKQLPEAECITLREQKIGNCAGDFFCWVRSPGLCNTDDDNRVIAAKVMHSDLLIYLTLVTFGGYSSELKRMVDHQIQNVSPYFTKVHGEIHHQKRYQHYPNLLVIGWMESPDPQTEAVFRQIVHRNGVNMHAKASVCGLIIGQQSEAALDIQTKSWLKAITNGSASPLPALPTHTFSATDTAPIKHAVLLVGSPRTKKSTSASLGGYLFEQLNARGIETQAFQLYTTINSRERMEALYKALDNTDLIVLAFPLYVDSIPAPVISALEKIAQYRKDTLSPSIYFSAIANCGFPEAKHNDTALAIAAEFTRQSGMTWTGGLALGAGEGIVHGVPLHELDGRAMPIKKALDLSAEALANGQAIPQTARDLLAKPIIPYWMYTWMGKYGWRQQAKKYDAHKIMSRQPYRKEK